MRRTLLERLCCPWCRSRFESGAEGETVSFGLLECDCSTYPIAGGVAVLRRDALTSMAVSRLQSRKHERAISLLLNRPTPLPLRQLCGELGRKVRAPPPLLSQYLSLCSTVDGYRRGIDEFDWFRTAVEHLESEYFSRYLIYRPFEQSFWNLHAFLPLIDDHEGPVLDFGGGWGHSSYLVHRTTGLDVYNVEIDFRPLYAQQQFMSDQLGAVVVEPGMDLPFRENTFGTGLDLDGFHYVENKYGIASEYERTVRETGLILLLHTHNRAVTDRGAPLSSPGYRDCFSWNATAYPETDLLSGFLDGSVRLSTLADPECRDQEFDIVVSREPATDLTLETATHPFESDLEEAMVNPLYEVSERSDHWQLQRVALDDRFASEFAFSVANTEPQYRLQKGESVPRDLLYRGVLAPLPDGYAPGPVLET